MGAFQTLGVAMLSVAMLLLALPALVAAGSALALAAGYLLVVAVMAVYLDRSERPRKQRAFSIIF